jgi:hypothetical protein
MTVLSILSDVCGWGALPPPPHHRTSDSPLIRRVSSVYFVAWSVSFYPQIYRNWSRKRYVLHFILVEHSSGIGDTQK